MAVTVKHRLGVFVDKVSEDGNGAEIGLRSKDVITKFDDKKR